MLKWIIDHCTYCVYFIHRTFHVYFLSNRTPWKFHSLKSSNLSNSNYVNLLGQFETIIPSHEAIISRDFPDQRFSFSFLSRSDGWKRSRCSQCFPETDHLITQLKFSHDGNNTAGNGGVWSRMAEWPRSSGPRLLDSIIINRMRLSFERTEFEIITLPFQPTNITYTSSSNFSLPLPSLSPVATRSINVITRSLSHETGR